jgi:replication factor C subunit 3/5
MTCVLLQTIDEFGYALTDIVTEVSKAVLAKDLPDLAMGYVLDKLSAIELRLSHGASERLQLGALVGAFVVLRQMMT